jgi:1-deoxy-D-xylulose-5-phosphate reductoisomerase
MGQKITIDSATMMNKGLEVIEAHWLFNIDYPNIEIVVHPQSIIHSMVQFKDGSVKAQLGVPDMKIPIQYALTYPRHFPSNWERLDFKEVKNLTFEAPNFERFPCLSLAYNALEQKGSSPAVLNFANDYSVFRFLKDEIKFTDIPKIIESAMKNHEWDENPNLSKLKDLDFWTKDFVKNFD